jgi:hypothetical protein
MKEIAGNIWDFYDKGEWVCITTNGTVKQNGECVMGRGVALEAKNRFIGLALSLGNYITEFGNIPIIFHQFRLITLPVKHNWYEKADIDLIKISCDSLRGDLSALELEKIYLVRPGCGNGQLKWADVKPEIEKILDDRFIIVERQ